MVMKSERLDPNHWCPLCDSEYELKAKELYLKWFDNNRIAKLAQLELPVYNDKGILEKEGELEKHIEAFGWDMERSYNTPEYYAALLRDVGPEVLRNKTKVPPKVLIMAMKQSDFLARLEKEDQKDPEMMNRAVLLVMEEIRERMKEGHRQEVLLEALDKSMPGMATLIRERMQPVIIQHKLLPLEEKE